MSDRDPLQPEHRDAPLRAARRPRGRTRTSRRRRTTRADADREAFWAEQAERLDWDQKWDRVLDWDDPPFAKWFVGGRINAAYNCVDRHVEAGKGDKVALHWVGEPEDDTRDITYADLKDQVCQAANALDRARRADRRPGRDLPADDPRGRRGDARLRADRRPAHRGVRRLLGRRAGQPGRRLRGQGDHHRRRRLPPRRAVGPQARRRRGRRQGGRAGPAGRQGAGGAAYGPGRRAGTTAATSGGTTASRRRRPSTSASSSTPSTRCT